MSHPVETLWRKIGLPEYFLGNGDTNHKLYALYEAIRADAAADRIEALEADAAFMSDHMIALEDEHTASLNRIEALEAALREIKDQYLTPEQSSAIARAALVPAVSEVRKPNG